MPTLKSKYLSKRWIVGEVSNVEDKELSDTLKEVILGLNARMNECHKYEVIEALDGDNNWSGYWLEQGAEASRALSLLMSRKIILSRPLEEIND